MGFAVNKIGDEGAADYNKSTDFKVNWTHRQDPKAHPRHNFSADVNIISSNFNKYNATTSNEYLSNTFKSSIAYQTNFGGKVYLTVNASHSQNTLTKQVTVSLPEMTLTVNRFYPLQKLKNSNGKLPEGSAGKNFSTSRSNCSAASISVGVHTPGVIGMPFFSTCSVTLGLNPGLTINFAPASIARSACSQVSTVPAPIIMSGNAFAILRMDSSAAAVRKVTSAQGSPPLTRRSARGSASSARSSTTTGTIPSFCSCFIISVFVEGLGALDADVLLHLHLC